MKMNLDIVVKREMRRAEQVFFKKNRVSVRAEYSKDSIDRLRWNVNRACK